jgi:hypothetical protein
MQPNRDRLTEATEVYSSGGSVSGSLRQGPLWHQRVSSKRSTTLFWTSASSAQVPAQHHQSVENSGSPAIWGCVLCWEDIWSACSSEKENILWRLRWKQYEWVQDPQSGFQVRTSLRGHTAVDELHYPGTALQRQDRHSSDLVNQKKDGTTSPLEDVGKQLSFTSFRFIEYWQLMNF